MAFLKFFKDKIQKRLYSDFLTTWQEQYIWDIPDAEEFAAILKEVKESPEMSEIFANQAVSALSLWEKIPDKSTKVAHDVLSSIIDLQQSNTVDLQDFVRKYAEKHYADSENLNTKLFLVGLANKGQSFQGALSHLDLLNHLQPGKFVLHKGGLSVGEVLDVSFARKEVVCEFDDGEHVIPLQNSISTLEALSEDTFLARRFSDPDTLELEAEKHPVEVIRQLLKELGPLTRSQIEDEMKELVIRAEKWQAWWQTTRNLLKKDTKIICPKSAKETFRLRDVEVSHEEQLEKELEDTSDINSMVQLIQQFIKSNSKSIPKDFKATLIAKLEELFNFDSITNGQKLQIQFLINDLGKDCESEIKEAVSQLGSVEKTLEEITIQSFKRRLLQYTKELRSDAKEVFLKLLFELKHNHFREFLFEESVAESPKQLQENLDALMVRPESSPEMLVWYFQKVMKDEPEKRPESEKLIKLLGSFFLLLHRIESNINYRDLVKKMHAFLFEKTFTVLQEILKHTTEKEARELLLLGSKCSSLKDPQISNFEALAQVPHPSLTGSSSSASQEPEHVWCTEAGFEELKKQIEHLEKVEIPKNTADIKLARSYGDLRENSEYQYAKDYQGVLKSKQTVLREDLSNARILKAEDVKTDKVTVGCVVYYESEDGEKKSITILGPYETDSAKGFIDFRSNVAQNMLGLTVGSKFTLKGKECTIQSIESYFKQS